MAGAGLDQAGEQGEEVRKLWASGIWAGWCCWGGFRREMCGGASVLVVAGKKKGEKQQKEGAQLGLIEQARLH
jgi:hypothetical protein